MSQMKSKNQIKPSRRLKLLEHLNSDPIAQDLINEIKTNPQMRLLAIVGSRKAEKVSLQWTAEITNIAIQYDFVIISGGAQGIDQQAHVEALKKDGKSLAIIGCGLNKVNRRLQSLRKLGVGLASPFQADHPPQSWTYPKRNQYIAELCDGLIVIQAAEASGSLLTARHALSLGKKVWTLPHHPRQLSFRGSLHLLKEGAWPLLSTDSWINDMQDEFEDLQISSPKRAFIDLSQSSKVHSSPSKVHSSSSKVHSSSSKVHSSSSKVHSSSSKVHSSPLWQVAQDQAQSLEALANAASMSYTEALLEATQLELEGWLSPVVGVGYKKAYP